MLDFQPPSSTGEVPMHGVRDARVRWSRICLWMQNADGASAVAAENADGAAATWKPDGRTDLLRRQRTDARGPPDGWRGT